MKPFLTQVAASVPFDPTNVDRIDAAQLVDHEPVPEVLPDKKTVDAKLSGSGAAHFGHNAVQANLPFAGDLEVILHRGFTSALARGRKKQLRQLHHSLGPLGAAGRSRQNDIAEQ